MRRKESSRMVTWTELVYLSAILAVVSTEIANPGGFLVFAVTLAFLAPIAIHPPTQREIPTWMSVLWCGAAVGD